MSAQNTTLWLESMPEADKALQRVAAWFDQAVIDRPPVRFSKHNAQYETVSATPSATWPTLQDRWFDAEYQVDAFLKSIRGQHFRAETFPVFWPNLGPEIYAAFFGLELEFGEVTSWSKPGLKNSADLERQLAALDFTSHNLYYRKIEELTRVALEKCTGQFRFFRLFRAIWA